MSKTVLLSIKPKYVRLIEEGIKRVEFRKRVWKNKIRYMYVYESTPTKQIIGIFTIGMVRHLKLVNLWNSCKDAAGISEAEFYKYFKEYTHGYCIEIKHFYKFNKPIEYERFKQTFPNWPPQNFCYISAEQDHLLRGYVDLVGVKQNE